jgi:hypothetical protein
MLADKWVPYSRADLGAMPCLTIGPELLINLVRSYSYALLESVQNYLGELYGLVFGVRLNIFTLFHWALPMRFSGSP